MALSKCQGNIFRKTLVPGLEPFRYFLRLVYRRIDESTHEKNLQTAANSSNPSSFFVSSLSYVSLLPTIARFFKYRYICLEYLERKREKRPIWQLSTLEDFFLATRRVSRPVVFGRYTIKVRRRERIGSKPWPLESPPLPWKVKSSFCIRIWNCTTEVHSWIS